MNPHFFTALFTLLSFGSGFRWRLRRKYTYDDIRSPFFPPSFGRRCPEGAEVGRVKRYSHIRGNQPRLASLVCPFQRKGHECFLRKR